MEESTSATLEKHAFEDREDSILKTFSAISDNQDSNIGTRLIVLEPNHKQKVDVFRLGF